jgi:hypothetical protein
MTNNIFVSLSVFDDVDADAIVATFATVEVVAVAIG